MVIWSLFLLMMITLCNKFHIFVVTYLIAQTFWCLFWWILLDIFYMVSEQTSVFFSYQIWIIWWILLYTRPFVWKCFERHIVITYNTQYLYMLWIHTLPKTWKNQDKAGSFFWQKTIASYRLIKYPNANVKFVHIYIVN